MSASWFSMQACATGWSCATSTDDAHPMHMHRHIWELASINDKPMAAGIMKDTVVVPYYGRAVVHLTADQPGLTLFHCHIQQHMDYGFAALFRYA